MNIQKVLLFSIAISCFILTGCKNQPKKEALPTNTQNVSLAISGMTCETGCAKTIESKLSKKEGVLNAKVIFKDSIVNITFNADKTSTKELISFVNGIGGGLYKAYESSKNSKGKGCSATKKECKPDCKKKCEAKKGCKKACSASKKAKKECKPDCKKECCTTKTKDTILQSK